MSTIIPFIVANAGTIATVASTGTSLLQFGAQRTAAKAAEAQGKLFAQQEEVAVIQREADRKERLADALASQTASAGGRGIAVFEGSPLTILQEDIRKERVATERDKFQSKLAGLTAKAKGKNQASALNTSATIGLAGSLSDLAATAPLEDE